MFITPWKTISEFGILYLNLAVPGELVSAHFFFILHPQLHSSEPPKVPAPWDYAQQQHSLPSEECADLESRLGIQPGTCFRQTFLLDFAEQPHMYIPCLFCVDQKTDPHLILLLTSSPWHCTECVPVWPWLSSRMSLQMAVLVEQRCSN